MLLLPLLSQEFTYRSRTKHNLFFICSHLGCSISHLSPSLSLISPSAFLPVNLQIHGATDRPVTPIQLADVGAVNEPTACWQTDHVSLFFFWRGNVFFVCLFFSIWPSGKSERKQKPLSQKHFLVSCMSLKLFGCWGQLRMETWLVDWINWRHQSVVFIFLYFLT